MASTTERIQLARQELQYIDDYDTPDSDVPTENLTRAALMSIGHSLVAIAETLEEIRKIESHRK